jgi:hypothetical protein
MTHQGKHVYTSAQLIKPSKLIASRVLAFTSKQETIINQGGSTFLQSESTKTSSAQKKKWKKNILATEKPQGFVQSFGRSSPPSSRERARRQPLYARILPSHSYFGASGLYPSPVSCLEASRISHTLVRFASTNVAK